MFRIAEPKDIDRVCEIYDEILTAEEAGKCSIGWARGVYPTRATAETALRLGELFVEEDGGRVVAAARINQEQMPAYALAAWRHPAPDCAVMVLHTLVVPPSKGGRGYGTKFVGFYEAYARAHGCSFLRMDTNARNASARALYHKLGYEEVSIVPCEFNGLPDVQLVCLEKKLDEPAPHAEISRFDEG